MSKADKSGSEATTPGAASGNATAPSFQFDRRQILNAWVIFVVAAAAMFVGMFFLSVRDVHIGDYSSRATAQITNALLHVLGDESAVIRDGNQIRSDIFNIEIIFECSGLLNVVILVAAILAMPSRWGAKLLGIVLGSALLLAINQVRLVSLVYMGPRLSEDRFEDFHIIFWQSLMVVFTVLIFLFWAGKYVKRKEPA